MTFGAVIDVLAVIGAGTCAYWATLGLAPPASVLPHQGVRKNARLSTGSEKSLPPGEDAGRPAAAGRMTACAAIRSGNIRFEGPSLGLQTFRPTISPPSRRRSPPSTPASRSSISPTPRPGATG